MRFLLSLLVLVAAVVAQNGPPVPSGTAYQDLPSIPGMDFVGFGYDVRYIDDPNQGLRLPLIDFQFSKTKTYRYPLYRQRIYKVPDELFVRTVGTATASNYEYSDIEDYKQAIAAHLGFTFERATTEPVPPDKPDTNNSAQANAMQQSPSLSSGFGDATANQQAGFGPKLPAQYQSTSSAAMELGIDFQFKKNALKTSAFVTVQHSQTHQLYQLLVSNQNIRVSMLKDINELTGKRYQDEKTLFKAFFEKYGTHYVQSAMLGGAIEMSSTTSNVKETDFLHITANASLLLSSNSTSETLNQTKEEWVRDSPACVGEKAGFIYNTLSKECVLPPEATCWSPMDVTKYYEPFNYAVDKFNKINAGDKKPEALSLAVLHVGEGCDYCFARTEVETAYKAQPWRWGPLATPARDCFADYAAGTALCSFNKPANATVESSGAVPGGGDGVFQYLRYNGQVQTFDSQGATTGTGISRHWPAANPNLIEYQFFPVVTTQAKAATRGNTAITFAYDGDQRIREDDRTAFELYYRANAPTSAKYLLTLANTNQANGANIAETDPTEPSRLVTVDTWKMEIPQGAWITVRLSLNWEKYSMRIWVKPNTSDVKEFKLLTGPNGARDFPFRYKIASIDRTDIYNLNKQSGITFFDEIRFCNDAGGSKYAPVTRTAAVQRSTATSRMAIGAQIDFGYENTHVNQKIQESSNYKLKGGDSSIVDLLNLRNKLATFTTWKASIPQNPAPVAFSLRSMAFLFTRDDVQVEVAATSSSSSAQGSATVVPREQMSIAIDDFLATKEVGEIIYTKSSDQPDKFEATGRQPIVNS